MFKQFDEDLTYLPKRKFHAKYTIPCLLALFVYVIIGQLITMYIPLSKLDSVQGNIISVGTRIIAWHHNRGSFHDTPEYALVITLDNGVSYNIQDFKTRAKLSAILEKGDNVVIYYPTETVRILSAGLARDVSQVEKGNQVLYSWKEQQTQEWIIVGAMIVLIAAFYWMREYMRNCIETPSL